MDKLIRCCSCKKKYDFKGNIFLSNKVRILICPHCGSMHKIDFKLFKDKISNLIKINEFNLTAINIGSPAIDRSSVLTPRTAVNKDGPANASGLITTIEIWANTFMSNCRVATFEIIEGNNLTTRDYETIQIAGQDPGDVPSGSKQTCSVNLTVVEGDLLGMHWTSGYVERSTSGYAGIFYLTSDQIPCENKGFGTYAGDTMSLYGIGSTVVIKKDSARTGIYSLKTLK